MSATPDYMTQLLSGGNTQGLNGMFTNSMYSPQMGLALGLLQAGGPSRMPVSLGQALGAGMQNAQQFQGTGIQNAMQKIQLQQALQGQQYFNSLLGGQSQPQQTPAPAQTDSLGGALGAAQQQAQPNTPQQAPVASGAQTPQLSPMAPIPQSNLKPLAPMTPRLPALMDPSQDPQYQQYMQNARLAEYFKQGSGKPFEDLASARLAALNNQQVTLEPDQAKLLIPGGVQPGQSIKYKPYSGEWNVGGESAIGTVPVMTPAGTMVNMPYDKRTGQLNDIGGALKQTDVTQPLPSSQMEDMAQRIAAGMQAPPTVSSRNPGAAVELARADAILKNQGQPGYDASTWPAKQQAAKYWNTGQGASQVTAFNAAESHLETMKPLIDNLGNTQSPAFNHIANYFKTQTGSTAPTTLAAAKQYVGAELAKVVTGSGGTVTEGDRQEAANALNAANTPEQLKSAIATIQNLIGGKMLALKTQYTNSGMGNFEKRLEGPARSAMQTFEGSQNQAPAANGLPQGWSVQVH